MDWTHNTIKFDQLPEEQFRSFDWKEEKPADVDFSHIRYLIMWYHKNKSRTIENLPPLSHLLYLELNWSNTHCFVGIDRFPGLKRLELHYCTKLERAEGIESLRDSLEFLHINRSKKLPLCPEFLQLRNLRVLRLNACGDIENLQFLTSFPRLQDFRFVDTKVLDGNLDPILNHPTLRSVGFLDKRHYNRKYDEIEEMLKEKRTTE